MDFTFSKEIKLKSRKQIGLLHVDGKSVFSFPFAMKFSLKNDDGKGPLQIMVTAPKRNFKRAHDRNRIKRLMREAIRLNKAQLLSNIPEGNTLYLSFTYRHNEILTFKEIDGKVKSALNKLLIAIEKSNEQV